MMRMFGTDKRVLRLFATLTMLLAGVYGAAAEEKRAAPTLADFQVEDAAGIVYKLPSIKGRLTVLHFWATWCVPCVKELPELNTVQMRYPESLRVVAVAEEADDAATKAKQFLAEHNIAYLPLFLDPKGTALQAAGIKGLPATLFFDREGALIKRIDGPAEWSGKEMQDFIASNTKRR